MTDDQIETILASVMMSCEQDTHLGWVKRGVRMGFAAGQQAALGEAARITRALSKQLFQEASEQQADSAPFGEAAFAAMQVLLSAQAIEQLAEAVDHGATIHIRTAAGETVHIDTQFVSGPGAVGIDVK